MPSPCFQFYPEEFVGSGTVGTADASEVCAYTMLLCLDWTETGFEFDERRLARWCKLTVPQFRRAWSHLAPKFPAHDGRHFNPRLEKERAKQEEWRRKSSQGGKKGADRRWHKPPEPDGGGDKGGYGGGHDLAITNGSPIDGIPLPLPLPSPLPTTTTPLLPDQPAKVAGRPNWPAAVAETWVRRVGVIREGRVGKDLHPFVRLYPSADDAIRPLQRAVEIYADLCTRRSQKPAWLDFVRGVQGFVPATMLPPERAA